MGNVAGGQVFGFGGDDWLSGLQGADVFYGGVGADMIETGLGADDIFYLRWDGAAYEGGDVLTDFQHGVDRITVSRYWYGFGDIGGEAAVLTADKADFVVGTTFESSSSRPTFFWNPESGVLSFDPDGNGETGVVTIATLQPGVDLSLTDIWSA